MNNSINIAVVVLGQILIYILNELNKKKKRLKLRQVKISMLLQYLQKI